jgi:hypothetical protein
MRQKELLVEGPFKIVKQDYGVLVRFKAGIEVTPEMIIEAIAYENERYAIVGRTDLWDFRNCRPSADFGYDAMQKLIFHIKIIYRDWSTKTALLVDDSSPFGLSRMFQTMVDGYPTQIGIFKEEKAALQWVRQSIDPQGGES